MHVLPCLSVFALPAYLCGPETGGPGSSPPRQTHGGVPTGGVSLQGDGERTGPTWAMEAYSPDPGSQVRHPPREPWLLFLQKPKGMRLGPCWAPARHASRLVAAGGGLASSPRGDWVLVPDPARAVGTSSLRDPVESLPSGISWQKSCSHVSCPLALMQHLATEGLPQALSSALGVTQ